MTINKKYNNVDRRRNGSRGVVAKSKLRASSTKKLLNRRFGSPAPGADVKRLLSKFSWPPGGNVELLS